MTDVIESDDLNGLKTKDEDTAEDIPPTKRQKFDNSKGKKRGQNKVGSHIFFILLIY